MVRTAGAIGRAAVMGVVGYLGLLTVAATARLRTSNRGVRAKPITDPKRRYTVLIPAHDEEQLIGSTLGSLGRLDYPDDLVRVHVVADNCADRTSAVVRASGFEVHEREDRARPGKGPALQWLLARLDERGELGDAVVFVDADTTVDSRFLAAIDREFDRGASVVQGHYAVADRGDSPVVAFRAAAMAARAFLRPVGRNAIGGSAGLHGNGMAFLASEVAGLRWSNHLTEDSELSLDLLLAGTKVSFAAEARVEAEMPDTLAAAETQHQRWERGRLELAGRYVPTLLRRAVGGGPAGRVAYLDAALDQAVPPLSVVAATTASWGALAAAGVVLRGGRRRRLDLGAAALSNVVLIAHVLTALRLSGAPRSTYAALLQTPRMIVWKLSLWLRVLGPGDRVAWTRTARNPAADQPLFP
jgi:1,2-diacylglycerol 3-beta-glucosyltransferase